MIFKPKNPSHVVTVKTLTDLCDSIELELPKKVQKEIPKIKPKEKIEDPKPEYIPEPIVSQTIVEQIPEKKEPEIKNTPKIKQVKKYGVIKDKSGSDIKWL